jgi:hypothetical protein
MTRDEALQEMADDYRAPYGGFTRAPWDDAPDDYEEAEEADDTHDDDEDETMATTLTPDHLHAIHDAVEALSHAEGDSFGVASETLAEHLARPTFRTLRRIARALHRAGFETSGTRYVLSRLPAGAL